MTELQFVENAIQGARAYARRWTIEPWFAYLWMLEQLLTGKMRYLIVEKK